MVSDAKNEDEAPRYLMRYLDSREIDGDDDSSYLSLTLPWDYLKEQDGMTRFMAWLDFPCEQLEPDSGDYIPFSMKMRWILISTRKSERIGVSKDNKNGLYLDCLQQINHPASYLNYQFVILNKIFHFRFYFLIISFNFLQFSLTNTEFHH
ncbi:hypothetical protein TI10_18255 [Photorhabdus luminescens subsp. luminescens]|uniref:Uncharacterized protein n=1 Tax=Photorhabdus luminescens TaxID=29488 RepID=A0A1G5RAY9_PHOLU|nr:hypothetical protein TI10_18255 [Photorhabdus luminescens subsp. luminescens]SCZ71263.1 Protein of unknown function [Photorhabdus luminescens]